MTSQLALPSVSLAEVPLEECGRCSQLRPVRARYRWSFFGHAETVEPVCGPCIPALRASILERGGHVAEGVPTEGLL